MLPEGSILKGVKFPRYDGALNPVSLLTADVLKIGEESVINGENVYIEMYNEDQSVKVKTRMERATFDQEKSILNSTDETTIEGPDFKLKGTALTIHEASKQAFVSGPSTTRYIKAKPESKPDFDQKKSTTMNLDKIVKPLTSVTKKAVTATVITTTSGALMAERPPVLTGAETEQLDQQAKPLKELATASVGLSRKEIQHTDELSGQTDERVTKFLKKIDVDSDLITEPGGNAQQGSDLDVSFPDPAEGEEFIHIKSDEGPYLDLEKGVIVYFKNIVLTSPDYKMSCSDELKIYLEPAKKEGGSPSEKEKSSKEELKRIIATGNVNLIGRDKNGPYQAKAEEAHYNAQTETVILRGKGISLQQGSQYIKSKGSDGYIKIPKQGVVSTSRTPWETRILIPKK